MARLVREASPSQLTATGRGIRENLEQAMQSIAHTKPVGEAERYWESGTVSIV